MQRTPWLALSYSLPINPSKSRVYTWRKLKEFGAEYLRQGIAMLPNTAMSLQQFTLLSQKIRQMGGEATLVEVRFLESHDEQAMTTRFQKQIDEEYQQLLTDCAGALHRLKNPTQPVSQQETERLRRIVKRYRNTKSRDYFNVSAAAEEIESGLNELVDTVRDVATDFGKQLRSLLDS